MDMIYQYLGVVFHCALEVDGQLAMAERHIALVRLCTIQTKQVLAFRQLPALSGNAWAVTLLRIGNQKGLNMSHDMF